MMALNIQIDEDKKHLSTVEAIEKIVVEFEKFPHT